MDVDRSSIDGGLIWAMCIVIVISTGLHNTLSAEMGHKYLIPTNFSVINFYMMCVLYYRFKDMKDVDLLELKASLHEFKVQSRIK